MLEVSGLTKRFGGVSALEGVSLRASSGRIHALLGENGAGKSTLLKCLSGIHAPDEGTMRLGGTPFAPDGPRAAEAAGLRTVHQELNLVPGFSAYENAFVGRPYPRRLGLVSWKKMRAEFAAVRDRFGLDVDLDVPVGKLSVAKRQIVEILRALSDEAKLLVLDEPTASLSQAEAETLHAIMRRLAASGCAIILVSHRLEEVLAVADDYSVLRNGRLVGAGQIAETSRAALLALMAGAERPESAGRAPAGPGKPVLELSGFRSGPGRPAISLTIGAGEIVGIYGVVGSGRSSFLKAVWGARAQASGSVRIAGKVVPASGIAARIAAGAAFVSEDRRHGGLNTQHSILDNAVLPGLRRYRLHDPFPVLSWPRARRAVAGTLQTLGVKYGRLTDRIAALSGGNQQKVVIGRWLDANPKLFLLDEPTRGVDVRSKAEIHALCRGLAASGAAIVFASSDFEELLALSTRILAMAAGAVTLDVPAAAATRHAVVEATFRRPAAAA